MSGLLALNWQVFEDLNAHASQGSLAGKIMVFGASDALFVLPVLLLALWFGLAKWSPLARGRASATRPVADTPASVRAVAQQLSLLTCLAVALALALNQIAAHVLPEQRPFITHPSQTHLLIAHAADQSFPSDHETVASAIAIMLVIVAVWLHAASERQRMLAVTLAVLGVLCAVLIGVSRIYVGVHYPGDILGGLGCGAIGAGVAAAARRIATPVLNPIVRLAERLKLA